MIVDTSALVAIVAGEPERDPFLELLRSSVTSMSATTYVEAGIVLDARAHAELSVELDQLIALAGIEIVSLDHNQARLARQAYRAFGKGSGHRAQLNLGDCFAYALAVDTGEPLLYKGDDFVHTGVRSAVRRG